LQGTLNHLASPQKYPPGLLQAIYIYTAISVTFLATVASTPVPTWVSWTHACLPNWLVGIPLVKRIVDGNFQLQIWANCPLS
jgi:hypothetical protein